MKYHMSVKGAIAGFLISRPPKRIYICTYPNNLSPPIIIIIIFIIIISIIMCESKRPKTKKKKKRASLKLSGKRQYDPVESLCVECGSTQHVLHVLLKLLCNQFWWVLLLDYRVDAVACCCPAAAPPWGLGGVGWGGGFAAGGGG